MLKKSLWFPLLFGIAFTHASGEQPITKGQADWHYWDTGETPPADWMSVEFDDSEWMQGNAPLGYGEQDVVTTVSYGEDLRDKHAGTFFRLKFEVEDPGAHAAWLLQVRCDDGALIFINEKEAFRYNMNLGVPTVDTFSASKLSSSRGRESRYHRVHLKAEELKTGENVMAVSVHQADPGSSDLFLDVSLKGMKESDLPELAQQSLDFDGTLDDQRVAEYIGEHAKAHIATRRHAMPGLWRAGLERENLDAMMPLLEEALDDVLSSEEIYQKCAPSVLIISGITDNDDEHGHHAGGFVISKSGLAITNHHVVQSFMDSDLITATALDGRVVPVLRVVASDEADDIAVLQLDGDGFQPLSIAKKPGVGADVIAISHPSNEFYCLTRGYVTRFSREGDERRPRMMISADFAAGSSGAPVFNKYGAVIGMVEMTRSVAYNQVPLHSDEDQILKLGAAEGRRRGNGLFLSMNHQMTLKYCIPSDAILTFLQK
jgi:hypothetical protein